MSEQDYDKLEQCNEGAFASIFTGHDFEGDRPVRIVDLNSGALIGRNEDSDWQSMLKPMQLNHRHLVSIHNCIRSEKWVLTESLSNKINATTEIKGEHASTLIRQALLGLEQYHENGLVHGGLCPEAFLLSDEHFIKLDYSPGLIQSGEVLGRVAQHEYFTPETINPDLGDVGPHTDFYSLGFSVAALLIGSKFSTYFPIDDTTEETKKSSWLNWHARPELTLESTGVLNKLPKELRPLIASLTAKHVAERPKSVASILPEMPKLKDVEIHVEAVMPLSVAEPNFQSEEYNFKLEPHDQDGDEANAPGKSKSILLPAVILLALLVLLPVGYLILLNNSKSPDVETSNPDSPGEPRKEGLAESDSEQRERVGEMEVKDDIAKPELEDATPVPPPTQLLGFRLPQGFQSKMSIDINGVTVANESEYRGKPGDSIRFHGPGYEDLTLELSENGIGEIYLRPILPRGFSPVAGSSVDQGTKLPKLLKYDDLEGSDSPLRLTLVYKQGGGDSEGEFPLHPFYVSVGEISIYQGVYARAEGEHTDVGNFPNYPETRIPVFGADMGCKFFGGRLCTEQEWQIAAEGFEKDVNYWKTGIKRANLRDEKLDNISEVEVNDQLTQNIFQFMTPISDGKSDVSPFGVVSMRGNVSEWCRSGEDIVMSGNSAIAYGGSFLTNPEDVNTPAFKRRFANGGAQPDVGYRLAIPLEIEYQDK